MTHLGPTEKDPSPPPAAAPWKTQREEEEAAGGRNPGKQSMQGRRMSLLLPRDIRIAGAVRTSLWKRSVTFTWEKLGDLISGFWCVLAGGRERKAQTRGDLRQLGQLLPSHRGRT